MYKTEAKGGAAVHMTVSLLLGGMLALGIEILLLLLGAIAVSNGVLSEDSAVRLTVIACVVGCLIGGRFACGRWSTHRLLAGVGTGIVCYLLILAVGLLMSNGMEMGAQGMIELASCLCGGAAAGVLCRKKKKGKRTARRSR